MAAGFLDVVADWRQPRREPPLLLSSCDPLLVRSGRPRLAVEGYGRVLTPLAGFETEELPELIRVLQDGYPGPRPRA